MFSGETFQVGDKDGHDDVIGVIGKNQNHSPEFRQHKCPSKVETCITLQRSRCRKDWRSFEFLSPDHQAAIHLPIRGIRWIAPLFQASGAHVP